MQRQLYIFETTKHIQAHTINLYIVYETLTYIQVQASPATDITLSFQFHWFSQFYFTHFACTVSLPFGTFCNYYMLCFTTIGGAIRCQYCSLDQQSCWETERFARDSYQATAPRMVQQSNALSIVPSPAPSQFNVVFFVLLMALFLLMTINVLIWLFLCYVYISCKHFGISSFLVYTQVFTFVDVFFKTFMWLIVRFSCRCISLLLCRGGCLVVYTLYMKQTYPGFPYPGTSYSPALDSFTWRLNFFYSLCLLYPKSSTK